MENDPLIAKLLDYGVSEGSYSIIMQRYPSSLKHWRASQHYDLDEHGSITPAILHFNIYTLCIETVCALAEYGVTHFDIKADNFLLEPGPCCSVTDFWDPPDNSQCPPFRVVITDFSESRISSVSQTMGTLHTNGTEYIKAPEILILSAMNKIREYHRGSNQCGQQADVWSLGCLLFEIIANDYM
jgi:serine/threonine protein kinase